MKRVLFHKCFIAIFFSFFLVLSQTIINSTSHAEQQTLNYLIFPAPPYMIDNSQNEPYSATIRNKAAKKPLDTFVKDSDITGIDVEIIRIIAKRMNMVLKIHRCPWKRCLALMESGDADILSSVFKNPEREAYLNYFELPYLSRLPIAFYTLRGKGYKIEKYEDIYRLNTLIGILRGASYFERFDKDSKLRKHEVNSQEQLIPMLMSERFDAFAGYVDTVNYILVTSNLTDKIQKSIYEHNDTANVYMAISKQSPISGNIAQFNEINSSLIQDGTISKIIHSFYDKYKVD